MKHFLHSPLDIGRISQVTEILVLKRRKKLLEGGVMEWGFKELIFALF